MNETLVNIWGDKECDAYFNAVIGSERSRHTYQRRLTTISSLAGGLQTKQVLDIGCGYGFRTLGLAKTAAFVTGVDVDTQRIEKAQDIARVNGIGNAAFKAMDAQSLAFPNDTFDVVIADEMVHHLANPPIVFSEMYRVTKSEGVMIVSDHNKWSIPSELLRLIYFGRNRDKVFSARQIHHLLRVTGFRKIQYKHIIFTLPFRRAPGFVMKMNYAIESMIERMPLLRLQCGVYVIRGIK